MANKPTQHDHRISKFESRKYTLAFYVVIIASLAWIIPPIISFLFFSDNNPLILMTAVEWISICSSTYLFYSGANLVGQHLDNSQTKTNNSINQEQ